MRGRESCSSPLAGITPSLHQIGRSSIRPIGEQVIPNDGGNLAAVFYIGELTVASDQCMF